MALHQTGFAQQVQTKRDTMVSINQLVISTVAPRKYNITEVSESLRLPKDILKASQNIQVIDIGLLRDQLALNVNESITRNVSGTFREELHNGLSADIFSRGGYINAQRNGVDLRPIMKGPSAFMNALGDPAGSYNIVTKKPTGLTQSLFTMTQGLFGMMRGKADLQGVYDKSKKLLYRINLMGTQKNGFMKYDKNSRIVIAPSITYNFDESTSLLAEYSYQNLTYLLLSEAQISPYGFGTLPIDFTITDPNTRPYRANENSVYLNFKKAFSDNWNMTLQVANINSASAGTLYWVYSKNQTDPDILDRNLVYDSMKYNTFSAQGFVRGQFYTGSVKNNFIGGIDFNNKNNSTTDTWNTATTIYPLSISNPVYSQVINNNSYGGDFDSENFIGGVDNNTKGHLYYISPYVSDEAAFLNDKLRVNAGLRLTYAKSNFD